MFRGVTIFHSKDLPSKSTLLEKLKEGKIPNKISDKNSAVEKTINLPSVLRTIKEHKGRILGVIDYYFQDRISKHHKFSPDFTTNAFILSPSKEILVILGKGNDASGVKNIITTLIDNTQNKIKYFSQFEIPPDEMEKIARRVRDSHENNWCSRPRISHTAKKYLGRYEFHDYSYGDKNCILDTLEFKKEVKNSTGISPIIKYYKCEILDPKISSIPRTMRLKHEGQISTSKPYDFEPWDHFLFDLVIPIVKGA